MSENTQVQRFDKNELSATISRVNAMVQAGDIMLPPNYSAANALQFAFLSLQEQVTSDKRPVLDACTPISIGKALFKMVAMGLSIAKRQGSFIPRGNELTFDPEYAGNIAVAKRTANVKDVNAHVIYKGDAFITETLQNGREILIKHEQPFDNINDEAILGAYSIIEFLDGTTKLIKMTLPQIHKAWMQGPMKGNSPAHKNFPGEMCKKTVINRSLKLENRTADDEDLFEGRDQVAEGVTHEIRENGNKKPISIDKATPKVEVRIPKEELAEVTETQSNHSEEGPGY